MKKSILGIVMLLGLFSFGQAAVLDEAVTWMNENDLTIFKTVTDYKPNNYIRRDEAAKLFVKFAKLKNKTAYVKTAEECKFSDLNDSHADLKDIVVESCRLGIFQGANGKFMPRGSLTNEQAVTVLVRILVGNQSETGVSYWSENYYYKASELGIFEELNNIGNYEIHTDNKGVTTRGTVGIMLFDVDHISLESSISKDILNIKSKTHEYLCTLGDEYCAEAGFTSFLDREKKYHDQNLINLNTYMKESISSNDIKSGVQSRILLEYYYGMIATKQFDKAAAMQGGEEKKSVQRYKDNYNNIQGIVIAIPGQQREQEPENLTIFNRIKKFSILYNSLGNNTYTFPVIVLEKTSDGKTNNTVYEVTKKVENGKIISVGSKSLGNYLTQYIPCQGCKPVIYFYPTIDTDITAKLDINGEFSITYPQIDKNNTRSITAQPDGTLTDKKDGKEYSYIFREANKMKPWKIDKGFVVQKKDYTSFLQEKLSHLGLTPREYNEFIVYRVPLMNQHPYVALKFAGDEYTDQAPLTITPTPDSIQRVFMVFKGLDASIELPQQILTPFKRSGFSVIERGGTEIHN